MPIVLLASWHDVDSGVGDRAAAVKGYFALLLLLETI